ncbi:AAA family ATPase [Arcicella sp. LKC2W]|uniref:AAA family ATPase n=1 Tax=Arcicella sp. LKC2W TaxID=2984198 RepID=UPI002B1EA193|nr:AAA family ATPase [Arcicella sp. LKC2W]MEA5459171.1 AAA family ATPase [Arcicella sp. LKC2W]
MKIQIKELGAIKEATIDLEKKITIFCGPNGTGKTYMAYVLYALTNLNNKNIGIRLEEEIVKTLVEDNSAKITINYDLIWNFRVREVENIKDNLWNLFAIPENKSKDFFAKTEINILETKEDFQVKINKIAIKETIRFYDYSFVLIKEPNTNEITFSISDSLIKNKEFYNFMEIVFLSRLYSIIAFYPITSSTIFPVERNSIYTFSNELSIRKNDALEHIQAITNKKDFSLFDLVFKRNTRYPQPIRDGLEVAEDLDNIQQRNSNEYFEYATEIENELLKGKVVITKEGNVEFVSEKAPRIKLSFHQSSSIVKTLASLVIYLKYRATKNDLVIIDEPELNLHPDNQVRLAKVFARLVNKGLRLVISTHSDYIIREFNNLIMISSDNPNLSSIKEKSMYRDDEFLKINDVGAYMFNYKNNKAKQTDVKAIKIDQYGFEVSTLDNTIEDLNKRSDELYYTLKYGKQEN